VSCDEFFELVVLLCSDFPRKLVRITYRTMSQLSDSTKEEEVGFKDFIRTFRTFFMFSEFFFMVLESVFENSLKTFVDMPQVTQRVLNTCKTILNSFYANNTSNTMNSNNTNVPYSTSQQKNNTSNNVNIPLTNTTTSNNNSNNNKPNLKAKLIAVPAEDDVKQALSLAQKQSINFVEFCHLIYNRIEIVHAGNHVAVMDPKWQTISVRSVTTQEKNQSHELTQIIDATLRAEQLQMETIAANNSSLATANIAINSNTTAEENFTRSPTNDSSDEDSEYDSSDSDK